MKTALARSLAVAMTGLAVPVALSAQADNPYTVVESGKSYGRLQDAVNAIGDGRGTIRFSDRRFADCAVQERGEITYVAANPGRAILEGVVCEDKAALVLRGKSARVEGLTFTNFRSSAFNGAGIRIEKGNLAVSQSWFKDSEQGIIAAKDLDSGITVDKSTFTRLGTCDGSGCAHSIYAGHYGSLTVTRSRFEAGTGGHYVKSRSPKTTVLNSSFDDTAGRSTNYMIDLPEGSTGRIAGNWFVQGQNKENASAFIAVAAEYRTYPSDGLTIEGNDARFATGVDRSSTFVADWSGAKLVIGTNALAPGLKRNDRR